MKKTTPVSAVSAGSKRAVVIVHPRDNGGRGPFKRWLEQLGVPVVVLPATDSEADHLISAANVLSLPALVLICRKRAVCTLYEWDMTSKKTLNAALEKFTTCK